MSMVRFAILFVIIALAASIGATLAINQPVGEMYRDSCDPMAQSSPVCLGCPTPILRYVVIDVGYNLNPNLDNPSNVFQVSIFLVFIAGIIAVPRFWCRYVCPVGATTSFFNKISLLHLHKDQAKCTRCNYCVDVCPTRVENIKEESESTRIGDMGCTMCLECVEVCPEKALDVKFGTKSIYQGGQYWWKKNEKRNN
jgi:ferredoxin